MTKKKNGKSVLLIQPHSDDILFSAFHYLMGDYSSVEVLTVENDPKRFAEDKKLYDFLCIPVSALDVDFKDESYYGFHKKYKEVTEETTMEWLKEYFGSEKLTEILNALMSKIDEWLNKNDNGLIVAPWGIGHPFHMFVTMAIKSYQETTGVDTEYYREFPHSYKRRSRVQVDKSSSSEFSLLREVSAEDFHDTKWELAKKFYKTQSSLLFFEKGYIEKRLPEEVYVLRKL